MNLVFGSVRSDHQQTSRKHSGSVIKGGNPRFVASPFVISFRRIDHSATSHANGIYVDLKLCFVLYIQNNLTAPCNGTRCPSHYTHFEKAQ